MTESSSFSSLLALVDSHLSKTSLQESRSEDNSNIANRIPIPSLSGAQTGTMSDTLLSFSPSTKLPLPSFGLSESPIQSILAEQVSNMLKAKELKRKQDEEKQRLADEMRKSKLEEDDCVIDLMQALQIPCGPRPPPFKEETLSSSSSFESLFEPKFIDCDDFTEISKTPEPLLPCLTDMSYILCQKIKKGKCSTFGKVLTSRVRPVAAPYLREKIETTIIRFDFKTQSPCDVIKEKLRRPTCYNTHTPDIFSIF